MKFYEKEWQAKKPRAGANIRALDYGHRTGRLCSFDNERLAVCSSDIRPVCTGTFVADEAVISLIKGR